ncbi:hypothetical protein HDV00_003337 [Rhizophlyctis rosea]|nr:hypothetical protein HDV00_003337 [Rhizophlyctis rosea]
MAEPGTTPEKRKGYEFYREVLKSPKLVVAPMVDQSELAWRILSRRYGAELCYTPMFHARIFGENATYRQQQWQTTPEDRPLIVQFCANDADHLLTAAKLVENDCDAVDINLGCPQHIAKRGKYGAFLMDEWELIAKMVRTLHENVAVPVTCKIRVFPDVEKTIKYAKMLEEAGCQLLTVHGRLREQKGHKTGLADWEQIRRVRETVSIPVFANGNILYHEDVQRCIDATGVDGVMTAEGNLYNPALFSGKHLPSWQIAEEYLEICKTVPNSASFGAIRAHLFKIFRPCLADSPDVREELAKVNTMEGFERLVQILKGRLLEFSGGATEYLPPYELDKDGFRILPKWVLQPCFRPDGKPKEGKKDTPSRPTTPGTAASAEGALVCSADGCLVEGEQSGVRADTSEMEAIEHSGAGEASAVADECGRINGDEVGVSVAGKSNGKRKREEESVEGKGKNGKVLSAGQAAKKQRHIKARLCSSCPNVSSPKCPLHLCKSCCKEKGRSVWREQREKDLEGGVAVEEEVPENAQEWKKYGFICETHRVWKVGNKVEEGQIGEGGKVNGGNNKEGSHVGNGEKIEGEAMEGVEAV